MKYAHNDESDEAATDPNTKQAVHTDKTKAIAKVKKADASTKKADASTKKADAKSADAKKADA